MAFYELLGCTRPAAPSHEQGRFTLVFMAPPDQPECPVELTYNWDGDEGLPSDSRHFGHLAYEVDNIYETCRHLQENGVTINRPPRERAHGLRPFARQHLGRAVAKGRGAGPPPNPGPRWGTPGIGKGRRPLPSARHRPRGGRGPVPPPPCNWPSMSRPRSMPPNTASSLTGSRAR